MSGADHMDVSVCSKTLGPLTLSHGLRASAARKPAKIALRCGGRALCYADLVQRTNNVVAWVRELHIGRGDRVAIVAPNCLPYIELVAGISDAGAAAVTVNYRLNAAEMHRILEDAGARVAFVDPSLISSFTPLPSTLEHLIELSEGYEQRVMQPCGDPSGINEDELLPFSLPYTSGTTGAPKGVMISHRSRTMSFYQMAAEYGCFNSDSRFLALAPLCHGAGFAFGFAPLFFGGTVTLLERFDAEDVLKRLNEDGFNSVFMVPTHFESLFALPEEVLANYRGHSLQAIISNASALAQRLKVRIVDYFGEGLLHETYGSTEAGIVTNMRPALQLLKPESVGLPFHNTDVELRDSEGRPVPVGENGELFSRGMTGFNGYWRNTAATVEAVGQDGWISVGDIARRDADGYLYIVDRKKDVIISGGINIYPREIESVIEQLEWVREVGVIGVADSKWGESVFAWVVTRDGNQTEARAIALENHCKAQLSGFKVPRDFGFIDVLPRNASGKLMRRLLPKDPLQS